ncbi:glycosyltransferase [Rubrivirga sp. S365]|uniref:glycosyltransferase family 2 protein n=1 Tax=Rubrivirga sp. S365 TaxID=3076080 RepID=UPI0028C9805C|nr:glycosyltransferase [Rubrivirga sp. S365]MDT7856645.1 glycosyltransferase [Rubrivirga sp. S365]
MSAPPLVSILMPAYNAERWLAESIASAAGQTYPNVEVVVVDDGSEDGSVEVARSFEERGVRVIEQENKGACAARNAALEESNGDYIKFLDADDVLLPGAVAAQFAALEGEPDDVVPFGMAVRCDAALRPLAGRPPSTDPEGRVGSENLGERLAWLLERNIQTSRPLHARRLLERVGGFDTRLDGGQEYDLHMRMVVDGVRFKFVPEVGVLNRDHASPHRITNSKSRGNEYTRDWWDEVLRLFDGEYPPPVQDAWIRSLWKSVVRDTIRGNPSSAKEKAERALELDPTLDFVESDVRKKLYSVMHPATVEKNIFYFKNKLPSRLRP